MRDWVEDVGKVLGSKFTKRKTYFANMAESFFHQANIKLDCYKASVIESPGAIFAFVGATMETEVALLKKVNEEYQESLLSLQNAFNEIKATRQLLDPELLDLIQKIRSSRMAVSTELQSALRTMREVRKFFLEDEYKEEIRRLQEFVALGEKMKALIQDGTLEAISDIVIKLMLKEKSNDA